MTFEGEEGPGGSKKGRVPEGSGLGGFWKGLGRVQEGCRKGSDPSEYKGVGRVLEGCGPGRMVWEGPGRFLEGSW